MAQELNEEKLKDLKNKANKVRQLIIAMLVEAGSGHSAGPLGMADIFTSFYFHILNHDPKNPTLPDRDRLVLSNGHICPVQYVAMALSGYFPIDELKTLRKINSRLQGHPHRNSLPGIETTSGPLGEGLSQAIGIALAGKLDKKAYFIYCLTSDGEHEEGNIWEAVMFAAKNKLNNLIQIIDRNYIQIDGNTEDVMPLDSLKVKYESFNWNAIEVQGNDIKNFIEAIEKAKLETNKPTIIIAKTVPGKGVSFMENDYHWHGKPPNKEEAEIALNELKIEEEELNA
ncbi:MAG: transketolase [Candidatus Levybacteria bacterium]|nr:transketolase [Candidatus Levybacteria bacterium]MDZ4228488.1 transketolase [Candidatus Levybacteria bacterium]